MSIDFYLSVGYTIIMSFQITFKTRRAARVGLTAMKQRRAYYESEACKFRDLPHQAEYVAQCHAVIDEIDETINDFQSKGFH